MSLKCAIGRARKRVEKQGYHIASLETRTRYTLIDPILQALGWHLEDPLQVKIEHETTNQSNPYRVDYALFSDEGKPVIIVEAKQLPREYLGIHKANREEDRARMKSAWEKFQCGEEIPNPPPVIAIWSDLTAGLEQLKGYVEQLELKSGYAVLTNGADWRISDIARESKSIHGEHLAAVNILFDTPSRREEVLGVLRRGRWK